MSVSVDLSLPSQCNPTQQNMSTMVTSVSKKSSVDQSEFEKWVVSHCHTNYMSCQKCEPQPFVERCPYDNDFWPINLGGLNIILGACNGFPANCRESCDQFFFLKWASHLYQFCWQYAIILVWKTLSSALNQVNVKSL